MLKNVVIAILAADRIISFPFFYGKENLFIVIATVAFIVCVEMEDLINDIQTHRSWKKKLAAELDRANREAQKKIG